MGKKLTFFSLLILLTSFVYCIDITSTRWGPEKPELGFYLEFKSNNTFSFGTHEGGMFENFGTYTRNNDKLTLTINESDISFFPGYMKQKTIQCTIIEIDSIFTRYKIIGTGGLELYSSDMLPKNGEKRKVDMHTAYVHRSKGKLKENARLREGPGLEFKYNIIDFQYNDVGSTDSVPKGTSLDIYGYSEAKTTIDGKEYPWYYCSFVIGYHEMQYGWIWGGLIDIGPIFGPID